MLIRKRCISNMNLTVFQWFNEPGAVRVVFSWWYILIFGLIHWLNDRPRNLHPMHIDDIDVLQIGAQTNL